MDGVNIKITTILSTALKVTVLTQHTEKQCTMTFWQQLIICFATEENLNVFGGSQDLMNEQRLLATSPPLK